MASTAGQSVKPVKSSIKPSGGKHQRMVKTLGGCAVRLRRVYKGKLYKAGLQKDGKVLMNRVSHPTASAAARAVCGHNVNGWRFWNCERARGDWVKLEKLRR